MPTGAFYVSLGRPVYWDECLEAPPSSLPATGQQRGPVHEDGHVSWDWKANPLL